MKKSQQEEIDFIIAKYNIIKRYLINKEGESLMLQYVDNLVDNALNKNSLKILKNVDKELNVWLREMFPPEEKQEIESILNKELNNFSINFQKQELNKISEILKLGYINNDEDYRLILSYIDNESLLDMNDNVIGRVNKIITKYERGSRD